MRRKLAPVALAFGITALALAPTGCSTMNNTEKGVGLGAAGGAGVGALIGSATGNTKAGAVIGGLAGGLTGGLIGNDIDKTEQKQKDRQDVVAAAAYDNAQPNRVDEIVQMVKSGQSDRVIVNHIRQNQMRFSLSAADLNYLKASNVPDAVIVEMQNSNTPIVAAPRRPVIVREEVIVRDPYYYRPAPPPVIFVGGGYGPHYYRHW